MNPTPPWLDGRALDAEDQSPAPSTPTDQILVVLRTRVNELRARLTELEALRTELAAAERMLDAARTPRTSK